MPASTHNGVLRPTRENLLLYSGFVVLTSWASLYIAANHTRHALLAATSLAVFLIFPLGFAIFHSEVRWFRQILSARSFWIVCVLLLTVADLIRYPLQSRKPHFSTAAPALIEPARQLAQARNPYLATLDGGAPISPGPGWIVLLMPLTLSGGVMLLNALCAGICAAFIGHRTAQGAGLFLLLLLLQPDFLSQTFIGHDLFAIPIVFAILCLLLEQAVGRPRRISLIAILAAAFATSRLPMIALLLILCVGLYRRDARSGTLFSAISLPLTLLWHVVFYLWAARDGTSYQPLHLFTKAKGSGQGFTLLGLAAALFVCLWVGLKMRGTAKQWMLGGAFFLIAAFVPVGWGELAASGYNERIWEGANYVSFAVSLLIAILALNTQRDSTKAYASTSSLTA